VIKIGSPKIMLGSPKLTKEGSMLDNIVGRTHEIFNNKMLRSVLLKLRYPIFLVAAVILITQIEPSWFLPGLIVCLFGEFIQLWCFASLDKNKTLAIKGPYMLTRNPMYIGRFFLLLGCLLLAGNIWVILVFTVLYYFYMVNRVKREEKKLRVVFGEAYGDYCEDVNRFVPSFKGTDWRSLWFFKWHLLLKNNGHWNLLAVLISLLVFYLFAFG
jgi:protein-S-isoprenylcysteine O-methyltransferase Ste14